MYNAIPADHISTGKGSYPFSLVLNNISGAMYIGVPHWSCKIWFFFSKIFPIPKSHILMLLFKSIKIFSNFMSLWTILFEWMYFIPWMICLNKNFAVFSFIFLRFFTKLNKFPPFMYSIIIKKYLSDSNNSRIFVILGWFNFFIKSTSYKIFFLFSLFFSRFCLFNDLIATILPVKTFKPKFTFPKAPCPIILPYL